MTLLITTDLTPFTTNSGIQHGVRCMIAASNGTADERTWAWCQYVNAQQTADDYTLDYDCAIGRAVSDLLRKV